MNSAPIYINGSLVVDSAEVIQTYTAFFAVSVTALFILSFVFLLQLWGFIEWARSKKHELARMRLGLFGNITCSIITLVLCIYISLFKDPGDYGGCTAAEKMLGVSYEMAVVCAFIFMLEKASLVGKFQMHYRVYALLLKVTKLGLVAFAPVMISLVLAVAETGFTPEGRCFQRLPLWYMYGFTAIQICLTVLLVYLFLRPVFEMAKGGSGSQIDSSKFNQVYRRNAFFMVFAVCVTFSCLFTYCILRTLNIEHGAPDYYLIIGIMALILDTVVVVLCSLATTNIWMPKVIKDWIWKPALDTSDAVPAARKSFLTPRKSGQSLNRSPTGRFTRENTPNQLAQVAPEENLV